MASNDYKSPPLWDTADDYNTGGWPHTGPSSVTSHDDETFTLGVDVTSEDSDTSLAQFNQWYQGVHGYLSIVVCSVGVLSNVVNVIVLTRKSMATPTNFLLTAVAVADMLKMTSYWPFAAYFYCYSIMDSRYNHRRFVFDRKRSIQ